MAKNVYEMKEELRYELAAIALNAIRKEAGIFLTADEWDNAREKIADALRGLITV